MFNASLLFFVLLLVENRRTLYAVAMNIDNTVTRFTRKSRRFLQVLLLLLLLFLFFVVFFLP